MAPQKKYICAFCARAFSRSEHKQRHERSHTNEKPFHCQYCTSAFVRRDLLQRHCRTVHNVNMVPNPNNKKKSSNTTTISSPVSPDEEEPEFSHQHHQAHYNHITMNPHSQLQHSHDQPHIAPAPAAPASQHQQQPGSQAQQQQEHHQHLPIQVSPLLNPASHTQDVSGLSSLNHAPTPLAHGSSLPKHNLTSELEKKIVQCLSLSKKLNIVVSNYEKISILQSKDVSKIQFIASNFNSILSSDFDLTRSFDDYFLSWNILNKFKLPILDTLSTEIDDFIETFSNSSSISLITKFYSKFNEYTGALSLTAVENQKVLNIECKICLLYAILSIGAGNYNNNEDCVRLFMKSWNLLLTNLIPRLNNNTKSADSTVEAAASNSSPDIIKDQIQILKNLFTLAYVCFNMDSKLKELSANTLSGDLIFNYLDDISYIIMSHLEENNHGYQKTSRSSSSTSLNSAVMAIESPGSASSANSNNDTPSIIDENMSLFWSIYILLSNYFMINNHPPPKIYKFLLNKCLVGQQTLSDIMQNLTKSTVANDSNFNNEIISLTLSNELQCFIHYNKMFTYKSKSILHNSIIFTNRSLNNQVMEGSNNLDSYVFEMFKKKIIINSPTKYQGLLNSYIFNPSQNFNWNLLYISLKEFNLENYVNNNNGNNGSVTAAIYSKFKFNEFFHHFFHDFDIKNDVEQEIENNDQFKKDQYLQFIKYLLPFFTKSFANEEDLEKKLEDGLEMQKVFEGGKNNIINNNLGISSLPILFNYQFIKINPDLMKCNNSSKLNNFEKKRFNYLLMEWYLTTTKLIIGLKNDTNVYVQKKHNQHYRTSSQDSVESMCTPGSTASSNLSGSSNSSKQANEYSLSHNYIFQCLLYLIKEVGGKVDLPNGTSYQLKDFEDYFNFENDEFKITDEIIYCILKSLDLILEDWICMVNLNSQDILQSNGFKNMKKFVDDYIYSQLNLTKPRNEASNYYRIPHRNSVNIEGGLSFKQDNYVLDQQPRSLQPQPQKSHSQSQASHPQSQQYSQVQSFNQPPRHEPIVFQQTFQQVPLQAVSSQHGVQHLPFAHSPPSQHHQQTQISRLNQPYSQYSETANGVSSSKLPNPHQRRHTFKDVILPPILPPLSKPHIFSEHPQRY